MPRHTGPVLVDTNVIPECWRVGSWRARRSHGLSDLVRLRSRSGGGWRTGYPPPAPGQVVGARSGGRSPALCAGKRQKGRCHAHSVRRRLRERPFAGHRLAPGRAWRRKLPRADVARRDRHECRPARHDGGLRLRTLAVSGAGVPARAARPVSWRAAVAGRQGSRRVRSFSSAADPHRHQHLFPAGRRGNLAAQRRGCAVGAGAGSFQRSRCSAEPGRHRAGAPFQFGAACIARRVL